MGKEPVQANDSPGFISNRILCPMINEAIFCVIVLDAIFSIIFLLANV